MAWIYGSVAEATRGAREKARDYEGTSKASSSLFVQPRAFHAVDSTLERSKEGRL